MAVLPAGQAAAAAPVASNLNGGTAPYNSLFNQQTTIDLTAGVTGGATSYGLPSGLTAGGGTVSAGATLGSVVYTPKVGWRGPDSFTYTATNADGTSAPATVSVTVSNPTFTANNPILQTNAGFTPIGSAAFLFGGGKGPYGAFSATGMPNGLTVAADGTWTGKATQVGTFNVAITATDSSLGLGPYTSTINTSIVVNPPTVLFASTSPLPGATTTEDYTVALAASGGTEPYSYSVEPGSSLPPGLSLSSAGVFSGRATQTGTYSFTLRVQDATTPTAQRGQRTGTFSLTITDPLAPSITSITPSSGPNNGGTPIVIVGTNFSAPTTVSINGQPATNVVVESPTRLTAYTPPGTGFNQTLSVTSNGRTANRANSYTYSGDLKFNLSANSTVLTAPPAGATGVAYALTITSDPSATITVVSGSYPPGLTLTNSQSWAWTFAGAPTADGTYTWRLRSTVGTASVEQDMVFAIAPSTPLIAPTSVEDAVQNLAYAQALTVTKAVGTLSFDISDGALPPGLGINPTTGAITGTPTAVGSYAFTVRVRDSAGGAGPFTGTKAYTLNVVGSTPVITSLSARSGPTSGGTQVNIVGTGFLNVQSVRFGDTTILPGQFRSPSTSSRIEIFAPPRPSGVSDVKVVTAQGESATGEHTTFTSYSFPTVAVASAVVAPPLDSTFDVTITLTNTNPALALSGVSVSGSWTSVLSRESSVPLGGTCSPSGNLVSGLNYSFSGISLAGGASCTIVVRMRAGNTVSTEIFRVSSYGSTQTGSGSSSAQVGFAVGTNLPVITSIEPATLPFGQQTLVTIRGQNFTPFTTVRLSAGPENSVTLGNVVSSVEMKAFVNPTAPVGTWDILATNAAGDSASAAGSKLTLTEPVSPPTVTSLSPASGPVAGGTAVTINGTNFSSNATVTFGGVAATSFTTVSATRINAVAPAGTAGAADVVVVTAAGSSGAAGTANDYAYLPPPTVTALSPATGLTSGSTLVTVTGTGFTGATAVRFGASNGTSVSVASDTSLTVRSPAGTGAVDVTVVTPNGTSSPDGAANDFTYLALPTVGALSPSGGPAAGGTTVVLTGTGFTGVTAVRFGSAIATFTVDSPTQITVTVPAGTPATTAQVTVTNGAGTSSTAGTGNDYAYAPLPAVTGVSPSGGSGAGGETVVITGTGFTDASAVLFGSTSATFVVNSPTQITVTTPPGVGTVNVTVVTPNGISSGAGTANDYLYAPVAVPPTVTAVSPASGPLAGGNTVTITGTSFSEATAVKFGAQSASFTVVSATQITATAPAGAAGTVGVSVTNPYGTNEDTAADDYAYVAAPTVADFSDTVPYNSPGKALALQITGLSYGPQVTQPRNGTVTLSGTTATYVPAEGFYGPDSFTYAATGPGGLSEPATVSLAVGNPPAPTVAAVSQAVAYESPGQTVTLLPSGVFTSLQVVAPPAHGTVSLSGSTATYIPTGGYYGTDSFTYTATGPGGTSEAATASLTVANPPAPTVAGLSAPVSYNSSGQAIALQPSGVFASLEIVGRPAHGVAVLSGTTANFIPESDYIGPDSFTYRAIGPGGTSETATVSITVLSPAAPTAASLAANVLFNSSANAVALQPTGIFATVQIATQPSHGTATVSGTTASYTPTPGYFGPDSFTYTATGPGGTSSPGTVTLSVDNPPPPTVAAVGANVAYNSAGQAVTLQPGGLYTSVQVAGAPAHGTVSLAGNTATYVPASGYYGADSFTYTATGPGGVSDPATVSLTVANPPAPTAGPASANVGYNSTGQAIALSPAGVFTSLQIVGQPQNGSVALSGTTATYTPTAGYFGPDSFTYRAVGPGGNSAPATVSVTVATPPPPVIAPLPPITTPPTTDGAGPGFVDLGQQSSGVVTGFRVVVTPSHGSATVEGSQVRTTSGLHAQGASAPVFQYTLTYQPQPNFMGTDTVTVVAYGPGGDSEPVTFTFQVPGKAPDFTAQVASDESVSFSPTANLVGGPFVRLRVVQPPAFGAASVQGLALTFTPGETHGGPVSFDYVIDLPFGSSASGHVAIVSNLVPVSQALTATTLAGRPVTVRVSDNTQGGPFTDGAVVSVSPSTAGEAAMVASGSGPSRTYDLTFTPKEAFDGQAVVSFTLANAYGSAASTLTVTVQPRPDPALDPDVRGVVTSQITTARRFADVQIGNFQRRLEALREGDRAGSNGLGLNVGWAGDDRDNDPRQALSRRLGQPDELDPAIQNDRWREALEREAWAARGPQPAKAAHDPAPSASTGGGGLPVGLWTAGVVDWGRQDAQGQRDYRFTTQGVTVGADTELSDRVVVGGGIGYGQDRTRIGDNGSLSRGRSLTGAVYATWRTQEDLYLDGVVGYADLKFDSRRWAQGLSGQPDAFAVGEREGDVVFLSASWGHDHNDAGSGNNTYARLDSRMISLKGFTETGAGLASLTWDEVEQDSLSATLGAAWRWRVDLKDRGAVAPAVRMEWTHEFESVGDQGVRYADWAASPTYLVRMDAWSADTLNLDLGGEWTHGDRLAVSANYRGRLGSAGSSHGLEVRVSLAW